MLRQFSDSLWTVVTLLFQLVLVALLVALVMGDEAGSLVNSISGNARGFLAALNPASVAVAAVLYLFWRLHNSRSI